MQNLPSTYDPKQVEDRLYDQWEKAGYFHAEPRPGKPKFTIVIPPPNVTGQLHMGHALDNTMQDILIRRKRMQGYETLWQPGTDHASIATELKVSAKLAKQGIDKHELGREGFLKEAWAWKEEYGGRIISQLKKMGCSCDWERERFTMDEGLSAAVLEVFCRLYDKGLIYKGNKIINWCPCCHTSISDAEVIHEEQEGHLWHLRYPYEDGSGYIEVATTRPETMLGDTAVAVHPSDERYTDKVGKFVCLPLTDRKIPVIADIYVDKEFGTGAVKITPAHDPNDFEVGLRHNLEQINVLTDDGHMKDDCGKYAGMDRYEARKVMLKDLEEMGVLVSVEKHIHNVGTHDRCGTTVEPMIKPQWFVAMKELAEPAIKAVKDGALRFIPERFDHNYLYWLENIRDWCISRQLWWGHRIPAYYCKDCGEMIVSKTAPAAGHVCPKCGSSAGFNQDEDVLDTWFSSALWPFSTLGWPDKTPELDYFYPTDVLVTGYDIITFWVVRMVFSGLEHTGQLPFKDVLIHGLVRDEQGRKMSKSLGNGIDPLEIIDQYGADALRMTLISGVAPGNDMRFSQTRLEASRNFTNKLWNASRFILMNSDDETIAALPAQMDPSKLEAADRWILSKCNHIVRDVSENLDKYELGLSLDNLTDFMWEELCDWYIEMVKARLYAEANPESRKAALWTLREVMTTCLKLLHPFLPYISEEIYSYFCPGAESLMVTKWPEFDPALVFDKEEEEVELLKEAIRGIRNVRSQMNVAPKQKTEVFVVSASEHVRDIFKRGAFFLAPLCFATAVKVAATREGLSDSAVSIPLADATICIPLEELVDISKERERLQKELERLEGEIKRADAKLANEAFIAKAPEAVVNEEKAKREKYVAMAEETRKNLANLPK